MPVSLRDFNVAIKVLLATNALVLIAGAMLGPIYALFVEEIGGDLLDASLAFAVFAFVAGLTSLVSGKYADQIKENELILVVGYVIMGFGFLSYLWVDSILTLFLAQVVVGLGEAIYVPAFDAVFSKHLDDGHSGKEWGTWEAVNYFMTAIGSIGGGFLVTQFGFEVLFWVMGSLCFFSAVYIWLLPRKLL